MAHRRIELQLLDRVGHPARSETLPCEHLDGSGAEQRPHRHLHGARVGGRHDADAVTFRNPENFPLSCQWRASASPYPGQHGASGRAERPQGHRGRKWGGLAARAGGKARICRPRGPEWSPSSSLDILPDIRPSLGRGVPRRHLQKNPGRNSKRQRDNTRTFMRLVAERGGNKARAKWHTAEHILFTACSGGRAAQGAGSGGRGKRVADSDRLPRRGAPNRALPLRSDPSPTPASAARRRTATREGPAHEGRTHQPAHGPAGQSDRRRRPAPASTVPTPARRAQRMALAAAREVEHYCSIALLTQTIRVTPERLAPCGPRSALAHRARCSRALP